MTKTKDNFSRSMQMVIIGLTFTTCFTLGLLAWGWIDSIFFGNELSVYFANRYYRYTTGFILIPILGVAAFIMYWATRGNTSYMDAMEDKLDLPADTTHSNNLTSGLEQSAEEFAKTDPAFAQLLKRFYGYLRSFSGSGLFGVRQAIDAASGGKSYWAYYFVFGFAMVPFLLFYVITVSYTQHVYRAEFDDIMRAARLTRPDYTMGVIMALVILLIILIFRTVRFLTVKLLGPFIGISKKTLNTKEADPWSLSFNNFITQKHQYTRVPSRVYFYPLIGFCAGLPLIIGLVLLNSVLIIIGGCIMLEAFLLMRLDNGKGIWFRFRDPKTLKVGEGKKVYQFGISDIEEVIVHYQSLNSGYTSVRLSSESAFIRSLSGQIFRELMDSPELIPSTITFNLKNDQAYTLPLRFLEQNDADISGVSSHEIEFYFAYWLKSNGFHFEVAESNEDAGDWRAFRNIPNHENPLL
jgi:hypothetical protein